MTTTTHGLACLQRSKVSQEGASLVANATKRSTKNLLLVPAAATAGAEQVPGGASKDPPFTGHDVIASGDHVTARGRVQCWGDTG